MEWPNEADGHDQLAMNDVGRIELYIGYMCNTQAGCYMFRRLSHNVLK